MKNLIFLLFCLPFFSHATTTLEEGLILQNELRFLEEMAQTEYKTDQPSASSQNLNSSNELDLESTYFSQESDEVRSRVSAPARRRSR